jgi:hypothetical protein
MEGLMLVQKAKSIGRIGEKTESQTSFVDSSLPTHSEKWRLAHRKDLPLAIFLLLRHV